MKRIGIFCGASNGNNPQYLETAKTFGQLLAERNIGIVYGGASIGVMGALADAALSHGGQVIGVIPKHLADHEVAHHGLTELHTVHSMHERKALMADLSDAFITLPGGFGTLDELLEILTWAALGLHAKPIGILNVNNYFDHLLHFFKHAVQEGLISTVDHQRLLHHVDPEILLTNIIKFSTLQ